MIDVKSGASVVIEFDHHEVHHGHSFKLDDVQTVNGTQKWMVTTPNSKKYAHMIFDALCTGEMSMVVTEGADRDGDAVLTPINRNRIGTPAAADVIIHRGIKANGTTDGAITIKNVYVGITDEPSSETSESRGRNEYVLKPDTKYIVAITTIAEAKVSLHLDWYEHEDRRMQEHFNVE